MRLASHVNGGFPVNSNGFSIYARLRPVLPNRPLRLRLRAVGNKSPHLAWSRALTARQTTRRTLDFAISRSRLCPIALDKSGGEFTGPEFASSRRTAPTFDVPEEDCAHRLAHVVAELIYVDRYRGRGYPTRRWLGRLRLAGASRPSGLVSTFVAAGRKATLGLSIEGTNELFLKLQGIPMFAL